VNIRGEEGRGVRMVGKMVRKRETGDGVTTV
jgi:hypothetical protein